MENGSEKHQLFNQIQQICIRIISEQTPKNVQHLDRILRDHLEKDSSMDALQEYILFPIHTILKQPKRDEGLTIACLELMTTMLERTTTHSPAMVADVFPRVFLLLGRGAGEPQPPQTSEELRLAAVRCGTALVLSCAPPALEALYSERGRLPLGHAVFHLAAAARGERSRPLRLAAIDGLLACAGAERPLPAPLRRRSSRVFVALLPGVLSALHSVFAGDVKQGHRVLARAVHAWAALVCHVLGDAAVADDAAEPEPEPADARLPAVARTEAWLRDTGARLQAMLPALTPLTRHHQADVRLSVVRLAESVLTQCARTLAGCASPLLRLLILVTCDEQPAVRRAAEAALEQVQTRVMSKTLVEAIEEDFYSLTTRLPAVVRSHDVQASLVQLSLLEGYLHVLGPHVRQLTASAAHVRRLLDCLRQVVELRTDSALVPYVTTCGPTGAADRFPDFKRFRHFDEPEVWRRVCSACRLLGCYGDLATLLELLDTEADEDRVLWNQLVLGQEPALLAARGVQPLPELHELLDPEPLLQLAEPSQPAVCRCLGLEGLAHVARVTGGRHAALHVLALCPVLEAAGGGEPLVAEAARATLAAMAGERGVAALIGDNVRRLAVHVRGRLARRRGHEAAPLLVAAVLQCSGPDALPHLEDTVRAVMRALDDDYERCGAACLAALRRTVEAVAGWFPPAEPPPAEPPPQPAVDRLLEYHRRQTALRSELARAEAEEEPEDAEEGFRQHWAQKEAAEAEPAAPDPAEEVKPDVPAHIQLVRDILLQSAHFLDCDVITVQVDVLATLSAGSRLLAAWQDELLPLAARCWQPLLRCCRAAEPLLLRHALAALHALVCAAGDFLRRRVTGGPLRPLLAWLRAQAATSAARRPAGNYAHTQAYKLQLACLRLLGEVAARLRLDVLELNELLAAALPYLGGRQPQELQAACRQLLLTVARYDPDSVWLRLRRLVDGAERDETLRPLYGNARAVFEAIGGPGAGGSDEMAVDGNGGGGVES